MKTNGSHITVVGSINLDIVMRMARVPRAGETLPSLGSEIHCGGKGANQAVACARLGAAVKMVGALGSDAAGQTLRAALEREGVDCHAVGEVADATTGIAVVMVMPGGENRISLAGGANLALDVGSVERASALLSQSNIVICQLEIPLATVCDAVAKAKAQGVPVILNAAPAPESALPADLLDGLDFLVINETEAAAIGCAAVADVDDAMRAAGKLRAAGVRTVIVTLGAKGVVVSHESEVYHVAALSVPVVDTTAAGDTFIGGLAVGLTEGLSVRDAVGLGVKAAARCVQSRGAQASMPFRVDLGGDPA